MEIVIILMMLVTTRLNIVLQDLCIPLMALLSCGPNLVHTDRVGSWFSTAGK